MTYRSGTHSAASPPPERIGPYRILQVLGEGGMGIVYEAEELGSVRRRVAIKVVKEGMRSTEVLARFDAERQALAVMNHPGIARVLQAGSTESGQPYFAMELVRGVPVTHYCDAHRLSVRERLELFIDVCTAVQHAHQKGVIHRDLKPSNILICEEQGKPQPKIIDFGIAKALGHQLTDLTLVTLVGQALGTAAYMSPEQALSQGQDVDTRADIYSLGVVLYELLVGRLPVDPTGMGMNVFLVRLAAGELSAPSLTQRYRSLEQDQSIIAETRRTDPARLRRVLRGDLEWIVMKAMDPERARRYETANGLALDLRRHLTSEPVTARPPSAIYRASKFVSRHRAGTIAASVMMLALLTTTVAAAVGMVRANRAEQMAAAEAAAATQVTNFLVDLFNVIAPSEARGNALTARQILDQGAERIARDLSDQPALQGRLMHTMGTVYGTLGLYPESRELLESALRLREMEYGASDTLVAQTLGELGFIDMLRGDFESAERYSLRSLSILRGALGEDHPEVGRALSGLAGVRMRQGRLAEAESLYTRALSIHQSAVHPNEARVGRDLGLLGAVYWSQERYDEAELAMRRGLAILEGTLPADHPHLASSMNNLGGLYWTLGRYADALPLYQRAHAVFLKSLGPDHPNVASLENNLGETFWKLSRYEEAERLLRRALESKQRHLTADNPSIATTLNALAGLLRDQQRFEESEPLYRRALRIREAAYGPNHANVVETRLDFAEMLRSAGRSTEAAALQPLPVVQPETSSAGR